MEKTEPGKLRGVSRKARCGPHRENRSPGSACASPLTHLPWECGSLCAGLEEAQRFQSFPPHRRALLPVQQDIGFQVLSWVHLLNFSGLALTFALFSPFWVFLILPLHLLGLWLILSVARQHDPAH